ncbi:MAG TPA: type II secretion system protein [Pyrinomonadaceae bacterium]|nr:type II secretion system protein [Pyrinomonadaceae bacterium]
MATENRDRTGERGMTLIAVMAMLTLFAVALLAVAPSVHQEVQREKELESIRRGEEIADAIRQYIAFHNGKLPESMDDLLEGVPQGTKKRMILRPSAATDPLSADGKWRLIKADASTIAPFAKRVQTFNNGVLPNNPQPTQLLDRYSIAFLVNLNTGTEDDLDDGEGDDIDITTDNQPFIGVASQSRAKSLIAYYGIERHSNWLFTPLFRGTGISSTGTQRLQQQNSFGPQNNFKTDR